MYPLGRKYDITMKSSELCDICRVSFLSLFNRLAIPIIFNKKVGIVTSIPTFFVLSFLSFFCYKSQHQYYTIAAKSIIIYEHIFIFLCIKGFLFNPIHDRISIRQKKFICIICFSRSDYQASRKTESVCIFYHLRTAELCMQFAYKIFLKVLFKALLSSIAVHVTRYAEKQKLYYTIFVQTG